MSIFTLGNVGSLHYYAHQNLQETRLDSWSISQSIDYFIHIKWKVRIKTRECLEIIVWFLWNCNIITQQYYNTTKGVARGGGPGLPVNPLCKPFCKQTTHDIQVTTWWVPSVWPIVTPPPFEKSWLRPCK